MPKLVPLREKNQRLYSLVRSQKSPGGRRLTVCQLAALIGVAAPTLYNLINGRRNPSSETARKIAKYFGEEPSAIFDAIIPEPGR